MMPANIMYVLALIGILPAGALETTSPTKDTSFDTTLSLLNSIEFVGRGYNVFFGNPFASGIDPGFQAPLFDITSNGNNRVSIDGKFKVPDGIDAGTALACSSGFSSNYVCGVSDYSKVLQSAVTADFSMIAAPFSANIEYKDIAKRTSKHESVFIETTATCELFFARLLQFDLPPTTADFRNALKTLTPFQDADVNASAMQPYVDFLNYYGTHVVATVWVGGRLGIKHEFNSIAIAKLLGQGVRADLAASMVGFGKVGAMTAFEKQQVESLINNRTSETKFSTGTRRPPSDNPALWLQNSFEDPAPVRYTLVLISNFVGPVLRSSVDKAIRALCNYVPSASCVAPAIDKLPAAICPAITFDGEWVKASGCTWFEYKGTAAQQKGTMMCSPFSAMAGLRLSFRGLFNFQTYAAIGCSIRQGIALEFDGEDQWTSPALTTLTSPSLSSNCPENHFATGVRFSRRCLAGPNAVFVSLRCARSQLAMGTCKKIDMPPVAASPAWADATCPPDSVMSGIEMSGKNWKTKAVRLICCKIGPDCKT